MTTPMTAAMNPAAMCAAALNLAIAENSKSDLRRLYAWLIADAPGAEKLSATRVMFLMDQLPTLEVNLPQLREIVARFIAAS